VETVANQTHYGRRPSGRNRALTEIMSNKDASHMVLPDG
jgi:hypothetical protein